MISENEMRKLMRTVYKQIDDPTGLPWEFDVDARPLKTDPHSTLYREHGGKWYPRRCAEVLRKCGSLLGDNQLYGQKFYTCNERDTYIMGCLDDDAMKFDNFKIKCQYCGEKFDINRIDAHENSRRCRQTQARANKDTKTTECKICNKSFKNKYTYLIHLKSKSHKRNEAIFTRRRSQVPTTCIVCSKTIQDPIKMRRHLKQARKCHRIADKSAESAANWNEMYDLLNCKFNRLTFSFSDDKVLTV